MSADILHDFPVDAPAARVFDGVATPDGLDHWWTRTSSGIPRTGQARFQHAGWPEASEHYRISCYCRAMYLRIVSRWIEHGEIVPYENRLHV